MTVKLEVAYKFYPVGQGLFAAGFLYTSNNQPPFTWVYDCGTSSSMKLLDKPLQNLHDEVLAKAKNGKPRLDLVTLSHFDNDHISGLVSLLEIFAVGTLLLPYIPLWKRLIIAFSEGIDTQQAFMSFFIDPIAYITKLENANIERIVFVPSSGGEGPPEDFTQADETLPEDQYPWRLDFDAEQPRGDEEQSDFSAFSANSAKRRLSVQMLKAGTSLRAAQLWEFIPYNDADISPLPNEAFRDAVALRRAALLDAESEPARRSALVELRDAYDNHFRKKNRNLISLFLYAGQLKGNRSKYLYSISWSFNVDRCFPAIPFWRGKQPAEGNRLSVLYTGDAYLKKADRLERFIKFMGIRRIARLACLQVMHHGSKNSWYEGLASRLAPDISVFCAAPDEMYHHPDAVVVRDFLHYGPVLVDKLYGLTVLIRLS